MTEISSIDRKLDQILQELELIKNHLKIVPNREAKIEDRKSSITDYEKFAKEELNLSEKTITNQLSTIARFLTNSQGIITKESVKKFLDSNDSVSWKSNQLKALRRYIRDFLKLGNWITEFSFSQEKPKIKQVPDDEQIVQFLQLLSPQTRVVALIMLTSGLRISEVLSLRYVDIANEIHMINAADVHKGKTKHSWISFMTQQTVEHLYNYLDSVDFDYENNSSLFSVSARTVQYEFKKCSASLGMSINPHIFRTVFSEKCAQAGISDKYIDAFCGRISQGVLAKNYTDYSPNALRKQYDKVEPLLTF